MKMGTSILITSLNDAEGEKLAQMLADVLGLHFASSKQIVEYDLFDSKAVLDKCGVAYFKKREKATMKNISLYENSLIYMGYDLFQPNLNVFKNTHPRIYLRFPKNKLSSGDAINMIAYEDRNQFLSQESDLCVDVSGANKASLNKIVKQIREKL